MTLEDITAQRPKVERRLDTALIHLLNLVKNQAGGPSAMVEVKASLLALEVQHRLELELIGNGKTTMPDLDAAAPDRTHLDANL